jgi:phosphoenolpyruvate synthase/pyruvate phosphate dikinase
MVSGLVNADNYQVRDGTVIAKRISTKKLAIYALKGGGTQAQAIAPAQQHIQALTDAQIVELEHIGRSIEKHFARPQDIEWCLADGMYFIVQSRPITTLFPIPQANDQENRVYVSVGHQQMMTDAMKPLGLSFRLLLNSASMTTAGGRVFVDVTSRLASPVTRNVVMDALGKSDPLIKDALMTILARTGFIQASGDGQAPPAGSGSHWAPHQPPVEDDPTIAVDLIRNSETAIARNRAHRCLTSPKKISRDSSTPCFCRRVQARKSARRCNCRPGCLLGIVEGRARVLMNMEEADIEEGDILVTPFTDPSWTPLFVAIKGLVAGVGGLMTHGAVIAREYGLPAVVGVENATKLIKDGQKIRVNGTDGYVEWI